MSFPPVASNSWVSSHGDVCSVRALPDGELYMGGTLGARDGDELVEQCHKRSVLWDRLDRYVRSARFPTFDWFRAAWMVNACSIPKASHS